MMNKRRILTLWENDYLNKEDITILRTPSTDVPYPYPQEVRENIEVLVSTFLSRNEALGLAAPQIGINKRIIVFRTRGFDDKQKQLTYPDDYEILVNPRITQTKGELVFMSEGCLSCPEIQVEVGRFPEIQVRALDKQGKKINRRYTDFLARIVQHELDHLEGKLIIDYEGSLSYPLKRSAFFEKIFR